MKMSRTVEVLVAIICLAGVTAAYAGVPLCCLLLKTQGLLCGLVLSLLFGRFFCRSVCPLGILQSIMNRIFHPRTPIRRVCTRLPETKAQRIVRWSIVSVCLLLLAVGCFGPATMMLPLSIFGKALTLWWPGVVVAVLVLALAAFGRGRVWCNWICPFGTIFNLVSRVSLKKDAIGGCCGNCRRCFASGQEAR